MGQCFHLWLCMWDKERFYPQIKRKKDYIIFSLVSLPLFGCSVLCGTANPTKPSSMSACYLLFPRLCCLEWDLATATTAPDGAVQETVNHFLFLTTGFLSVWMNGCTVFQTLWSIAQTPGSSSPVSFAMTHFWQLITQSLLNIHHQMSASHLPDICILMFHSVHHFRYKNSSLTYRKQPCELYLVSVLEVFRWATWTTHQFLKGEWFWLDLTPPLLWNILKFNLWAIE